MTARVIPPLAAISPGLNNEAALFTVTDAQLTASTLPEAPAVAWSSGATYALGAKASLAVGGNAFDVYESLQASNNNHAPASSPLWWKLLGRTHGVFAAGTYAKGDIVIELATHLEYESQDDGNTAPLTDNAKWVLLGPSNLYRAFDVLRNTKAAGPSGTSFTVTPGKRIDAIGLAGLIADRVEISLEVGGEEVWSHSEGLSTRNTQSWSDYFFGAFNFRSSTAVFNIPKYSGAVITITLYRSTGNVEVGSIFINEAVYLGELEVDPNVDRRNFSTIDRKPTGELRLIRRRTIPTNDWTVFCPKNRLSKVKPLPDELNAVPAMWVGLEATDDEYFDLVTMVAVYTRFTITPGHPDARIDLGLEET
jgi:hypothetical protein